METIPFFFFAHERSTFSAPPEEEEDKEEGEKKQEQEAHSIFVSIPIIHINIALLCLRLWTLLNMANNS